MLNCGESANEQAKPSAPCSGDAIVESLHILAAATGQKKRSRDKLDAVDKMLDFSLKGIATKCSKTVDGDGHFGEHVAYTMHF